MKKSISVLTLILSLFISIDEIKGWSGKGPSRLSYFGNKAIPLYCDAPERLETIEVTSPNRNIKKNILPGDTLHVSFGVLPETWEKSSLPITAAIAISDGERTTTIFEKTLNPKIKKSDRGWHHRVLSLNQYKEKEVTIKFSSKGDTKKINPSVIWGGVRIGDFKRSSKDYNVILISLDTLRADHLGTYGYKINTSPHIDKLAKESVVFTQAIAQAPWTKPSHMSIFTGLYPSFHGMNEPSEKDKNLKELSENIPLMAEFFQRKGYLTHAFTGSAYLSSRYGFSRGFDRYIEVSKVLKIDSPFVFNNGIDWIKNRRREKFFLFLHTYDIHTPYRFSDLMPARELSAEEDLRYSYDSGIHYVDQFIGKLTSELKQLKLLDKTIIIITSDHGEELNQRGYWPEHGHSLYDEIIRIPLIVYAPNIFPPRTVTHQVQHIDLLPTLLQFLEIQQKDTFLQGISFYDLLKGEERKGPSLAISEAVEYGFDDLRTVRFSVDDRLEKYIFSPSVANGEKPPVPLGKKSLKNAYWFRGVIPAEGREYYDLIRDPAETTNLSKRERPKGMALEKTLNDYILSIPTTTLTQPIQPTMNRLEIDLIEKLRSLGY